MKRIILLALAALLIGAGASALITRATRAERRLTEVYQASLDRCCEELGEMEAALDKLAVSADSGRQAALLSQIGHAADDIRRDLSDLPVDHYALGGTLTFVSRVSGYADALLEQVAAGDLLTAEDRAQLTDELLACRRLAGEMSLARLSVARSAASFSLVDAATAYPVLAYHGQYGAPAAASVALDGKPISRTRAEALARELFAPDKIRSAQWQRTSAGDLAAHEVTVALGDLTVDAAFTVQGGHLLWLTPERADFAQLLTADECAEAAMQFLNDHGFTPAAEVWREQYNGLCVVTLAAQQDGVILYADLLHVQVRMDTGEVVGFDASAYWRHHQPRTLPAPALSAAEAAALLAPYLTVSTVKLCLLPRYGEELFCYEADVLHGDDRFLIYVDAQTGREALILKLVDTDGGTRPV